MIKPNKKEVGNRIKLIRLNNSDNLREFGEKIDNAADSIVSRWEKGKSLPNSKRLKLISEIGDVSVDYLLYGNPINFLQKNFSLKSEKYDLSNLDSEGQSYLYRQILTKYNFYLTFSIKEISTKRDEIFDYNELLEFASNNLDLIISELIERAKKIINTFKDYETNVLEVISKNNLIYKKYLNKESITTCDIINNFFIFKEFEVEKRITLEENKANNIYHIAYIINEILRFNVMLSERDELTEEEKRDFENFLGIIKNEYSFNYVFDNTLLETSELRIYINGAIYRDIDFLLEKYSQLVD
ncbi:helix-turn-helix domain-containing protein [Staphylococcus hominis]|uniref:helix-turn-helix domain-containing protein n=1 Tax=Staphylococcus hominis TaxID=1290 RepID=UPI00080E79EE|nr:helix-turn-helix transcriptional regulator [Staphylococcus hominis]